MKTKNRENAYKRMFTCVCHPGLSMLELAPYSSNLGPKFSLKSGAPYFALLVQSASLGS